ncbi:MAG: hypothetical protein KJ069_17845 [Anaerolineae bacterium]|nr:hypothetical protein [Anaerolineae bacterium]
MADVSYRSITHWTAPQLSARPVDEKGGYAALANALIAAGEVVATWGGEIVTGEQLAHYPAFIQTHSLQIEENLYWWLPTLQKRYAGHFSPYLQRRIDRWRQKQFTVSRPAVNGRASTTPIQS